MWVESTMTLYLAVLPLPEYLESVKRKKRKVAPERVATQVL
jgi:hypothetical protein